MMEQTRQAGASMYLQADMQSKESKIASLSLGGLQLSDRLIIKFNDDTDGKPETILSNRWGVGGGHALLICLSLLHTHALQQIWAVEFWPDESGAELVKSGAE